MKYNINWLLEQKEKEERIKYLFFWGHTPSKDGSVNASCLSQWWESSFEVDGIEYKTAEHWMMAGKAKLFDESSFDKIIEAENPALAQKLGRKIKNFDSEIWNREKYNIVVQGNIHKFGQNEELGLFLEQTNHRVLVEASPVDKIWGIGLAKNDERVYHPSQWEGENLLGFALMEARDALRA